MAPTAPHSERRTGKSEHLPHARGGARVVPGRRVGPAAGCGIVAAPTAVVGRPAVFAGWMGGLLACMRPRAARVGAGLQSRVLRVLAMDGRCQASVRGACWKSKMLALDLRQWGIRDMIDAKIRL